MGRAENSIGGNEDFRLDFWSVFLIFILVLILIGLIIVYDHGWENLISGDWFQSIESVVNR